MTSAASRMAVRYSVNAFLALRAVIRTVQAHNRSAARPMASVLCPGLATAVGRMPPKASALLADASRHQFELVTGWRRSSKE
jgi:hypothetical protein